jgi:methylated-DNA-protein-cysteine methyltransferase-like protein
MTERSSDEREQQILNVLRSLGPGEVVTYGDIAADAGYPKQSRFVGRVLATTDEAVPWWRVVNAVGRLVPGHEREQSALLMAEGVEVRDGKVRRATFGRFARSGASGAGDPRPD